MNEIRVLLPLLSTLAVVPTAAAAPSDICVRQAEGVAYSHKPPDWWSSGLSSSQREVRWVGATSRASGQGATGHPLARARMIWDRASKQVFFELEANDDQTLDPGVDLVKIVLSDGSGTAPELFLQFDPLSVCTSAPCSKELGSSAVSHAWYTSAWGNLEPGGPSSQGFGIDKPWVNVSQASATSPYDWTLSFKLTVPHTNGNIRPNLRIYGNMMVLNGDAGLLTEIPLLCNEPGSPGCALKQSGSTDQSKVKIADISGHWPLLTSDGSVQCGGVELIRELVGSDYNRIKGTKGGSEYWFPGSTIPASGAFLLAGFYNGTGKPIPDGGIEAKFFVADWGMQFQSAQWTPVGTGTLAGEVSTGSYAGGTGQGFIRSEAKWTPSQSLKDKNTHQCVYVRLESTKPWDPTDPSKPNLFKVDSVYRNMDLLTASVARRPATIDLGDRPLPKGKDKHEVYLLVRTRHMPDPATCRAAKGDLYGCARGGRLVRARLALTKAQKRALKTDFAAGRTSLDEEQLGVLLAQKDRKGKKTEELPFVMVYGLIDTGRRIDLPGAPKTPVLEHFSEFGYYVEHEGDLEGWETLVHGAEPVPGTQNLFKLEIEPNKVASVANTVRVLSKETKACKTRPHPRLGVVSQEKTEEIEAKLLTDVGKGDHVAMRKIRRTDDQLGCDPPPLRMQCRLKDCREHSPATIIDGSRYVGDWTVLERRKLVKPSEQPDAEPVPAAKPSAKPKAKPKAGG